MVAHLGLRTHDLQEEIGNVISEIWSAFKKKTEEVANVSLL